MFIKDGKRINIYARHTTDEGVTYANLTDPAVRSALGVTEIPDPIRESDVTHFVSEIDEAPYVINTPKPIETVMQYHQNRLTQLVQAYLDEAPRARGYDGILSACTYATSTKPRFAAEGQACVEWRDDVWTKCYEMLDQVTAGERPIPTDEELISELPVLIWPV